METTIETSVLSAAEKHSKGVRLYAEERFREALAVLEDALSDNRDARSEYWNDWGVAALACDDARNAEKGFRRALELSPEDIQAAANLGMLLAGLDRPGEAIPFLTKSVENVGGEERAKMAQLLTGCRNRVASAALRRSQAAFQGLVSRLESTAPKEISKTAPGKPGGAPPIEPADKLVREYWFPEITGWFSCGDALHLYTAIKLKRPRRIFEIGTFYGRSTATICAAIKGMKRSVEFVTVDLDFRCEEEFTKTFREIHGLGDISMPPQYNEAFESGMSTTEYARHQLSKVGFTEFVKIESGDFRSVDGKFDFVFADVMHDKAEILRNLPAILPKIENDGVLAMHDLADDNKNVIEQLSTELEFISRCETLGIYRVRPTS
jgi:predicted O-methyltransferase YrrM